MEGCSLPELDSEKSLGDSTDVQLARMADAVDLTDALLALFFAAPQPVTIDTLAAVLEVSQAAVRGNLEKLMMKLEAQGPLQLLEIQEGFQLSTKPEYAEILARYLKPEPHKLSRSMMETLAIVAYRQPMTLAEIESVRGVMSDYSLRSLVDRGLVQEVGRKQTPGRPILYGTTAVFLHQFKLKELGDLPALPAAENDRTDLSNGEN